jgi:hypothetical protein
MVSVEEGMVSVAEGRRGGGLRISVAPRVVVRRTQCACIGAIRFTVDHVHLLHSTIPRMRPVGTIHGDVELTREPLALRTSVRVYEGTSVQSGRAMATTRSCDPRHVRDLSASDQVDHERSKEESEGS